MTTDGRQRRRYGLAAALSTVLIFPSAARPAPLAHGLAVVPRRDNASVSAPSSGIEYRYRIVGKVRLALFWIGRDDVGSARLTWRSHGEGTDVTFLAGSEPDRAPGRLNQWVYLREERRAEHGSAFVLRSVNPDDAGPAAPFPVGAGTQFGASCTAVADARATTAGTTVSAPDATYRMFDRVLEQIASARTWKRRDAPVPPGAAAGFLTALQQALDADAHGAPLASVTATYIYDGRLFDLRVRRRRQLGTASVGGRSFAELVRLDLAVQNRVTGDVTKFSVAYAPAAGSLPVQILFQPSFWIRIELHLDDNADAPADPASNDAVLARIHAICGRSLRAATNN